jgi:hypothetical protein
MSRRIPLGTPRGLIWKVMSSGYMGGTVGDSIANGTLHSAYVLDFIKDAAYSFADAAVAQQTGGGKRILNVVVGDRPAEPFTVTVGDLDDTVVTMATGGAVDTRNSEFRKWSQNPSQTDLPIMGFAIQQMFFDPSRTSGSQKYWLTDVFLSCTVEPKQGARNENNASDSSYRIVPTYTRKDLTGETFSESSGMQANDGLVDFIQIESDYPIHFAVAKLGTTGANGTFTLPYLPLSSTVTINATPNAVWKNGAAEAALSVGTSTGQVVFAMGTAADVQIIQYETNYVASS